MKNDSDVVVVGAGHNGLVAATFLARAGLSVRVVEGKAVVGGAARTEYPFARAPRLGTSTGAYLLGLMPPELMTKLGIDVPLLRRDPHYFLPTTGKRYLLFGSDAAATRDQMLSFFSARDLAANDALQAEVAQLREDVHATWLEEPLSIEDTAAKYVRPALRSVFVDLCRKPVGVYLERFGFQSDLLKAMYAVTDGFAGLTGAWDTPGTGMNFLVHNMCRLPGSDGTWMIVRGGMGTVARLIGDEARKAGAIIETGRAVAKIDISGNATNGVVLEDGTTIRAQAVVAACDPFRMRDLVGDGHLPAWYENRLENYRRDGTTMKVNLALRALPRFTCLPEDRGQFGSTMHLLPDESEVMGAMNRAFADASAGILPEFPTIEWYVHTTVDPSLRDAEGRHNSALFVQWVPYRLRTSTWEAEEQRYVRHLLSICDRFAPGTSDLVVDAFPLPPPKIEAHFGITRGHIHHVDNSFGFADRLPYSTPIEGLYAGSAGCHPGGSVIGAAGHNAAARVLRDLGLRLPA
ncbi:MAG: phytoene desaturase family protein [Myxococcales bacterium]